MVWFKRITLFLAVNILVMITLSFILNVLGVRPYITAYGLNYTSLMIFCLIWGMGGALISLMLSRVMAKWMMGVEIIPPDTRDPDLRDLVEMVHELSRLSRLPVMPQVGIYDSPEVNAFATGPSRSKSLVAVSTGLLRRMKRDEVKGVLGHEVAHIANGDMVTMTLIQGVVNAFVMFLARAIAYGLTMAKGQDGEQRHGNSISFYVVSFVLEIAFMILGSMVVAWFSRYREYRADAGGARLAGRGNMILALEGLRKNFDPMIVEPQSAVQALKISSAPGRLMRLFSTHPPLEDRIARLKQAGV